MKQISPKVSAATLAAAAVTILAWLLAMLGVELPTEVQGALTTIGVFAAGWIVPDPARGDTA